jgi:hypothetical protein
MLLNKGDLKQRTLSKRQQTYWPKKEDKRHIDQKKKDKKHIDQKMDRSKRRYFLTTLNKVT